MDTEPSFLDTYEGTKDQKEHLLKTRETAKLFFTSNNATVALGLTQQYMKPDSFFAALCIPVLVRAFSLAWIDGYPPTEIWKRVFDTDLKQRMFRPKKKQKQYFTMVTATLQNGATVRQSVLSRPTQALMDVSLFTGYPSCTRMSSKQARDLLVELQLYCAVATEGVRAGAGQLGYDRLEVKEVKLALTSLKMDEKRFIGDYKLARRICNILAFWYYVQNPNAKESEIWNWIVDNLWKNTLNTFQLLREKMMQMIDECRSSSVNERLSNTPILLESRFKRKRKREGTSGNTKRQRKSGVGSCPFPTLLVEQGNTGNTKKQKRSGVGTCQFPTLLVKQGTASQEFIRDLNYVLQILNASIKRWSTEELWSENRSVHIFQFVQRIFPDSYCGGQEEVDKTFSLTVSAVLCLENHLTSSDGISATLVRLLMEKMLECGLIGRWGEVVTALSPEKAVGNLLAAAKTGIEGMLQTHYKNAVLEAAFYSDLGDILQSVKATHAIDCESRLWTGSCRTAVAIHFCPKQPVIRALSRLGVDITEKNERSILASIWSLLDTVDPVDRNRFGILLAQVAEFLSYPSTSSLSRVFWENIGTLDSTFPVEGKETPIYHWLVGKLGFEE